MGNGSSRLSTTQKEEENKSENELVFRECTTKPSTKVRKGEEHTLFCLPKQSSFFGGPTVRNTGRGLKVHYSTDGAVEVSLSLSVSLAAAT